MNPKEKAAELVHKFKPFVQFKMGVEQAYVLKMAKECAYIAADELIKEQTMWQNGEVNPVLYWQEVKKEIKLL